MGSDSVLYVGAYAEFSMVRESKVFIEKKCSEHPKKTFSLTSNFCAICGSKLEEVNRRDTRSPNYWDLASKADLTDAEAESFQWVSQRTNSDNIYLIGNLRNTNPDCFDMDVDAIEFAITPEVMQAHLDSFRKSYHVILRKLECVSGKMEIKFGLLKYWV